jgi:RNA polymerase sigma factor (sigma-70 family)
VTVVHATDQVAGPPSWFVAALVAELPSLRRVVPGDPSLRDDVLQEAFLAACRGWATFDADRPMGPWLRRLVRISAARLEGRARRARGVEAAVAPLGAGDHVGSDDHVAVLDRRRALRAALGELGPRERALLWHRHAEDLPWELVAALSEVAPGGVRMAVSRAGRRLRVAYDAARSGEGRLGGLLAALGGRRGRRDTPLDRLLPLVPAPLGAAVVAVALVPAGLVLRAGDRPAEAVPTAAESAVTRADPLRAPTAATLAPGGRPAAPSPPVTTGRPPLPAAPSTAPVEPPAPGLRVGGAAGAADGAADVRRPTPAADVVWYQGIAVRCRRSLVLTTACTGLRATPAGEGLEVSPTGPES